MQIPNLTLRQLTYFLVSFDLGSIAKASAQLNISQPAVSVAISKLEDTLGQQLFLRRHARNIVPTEFGKFFACRARQLVDAAIALENLDGDANGSLVGAIRFGSFVSLAPRFMPRLLADLSDIHPDIRLTAKEASQNDLLLDLDDGRIEMALLYDLDLPPNLEKISLGSLSPYVALPAAHPYAGASAVNLKDLAQEPFVLLDLQPSRDYFLGILSDNGITPKIAFETSSLEVVRGLVAQNFGYSLLVTRPHGDHSYDGAPLVVRPIAQPCRESRVVVAHKKSMKRSMVHEAFLYCCKMSFENTLSS